MAGKQAIISDAGTGAIKIAAPYNADWIERIRDLPRDDRTWFSAEKAWKITAASVDEAMKITARYFDILDTRITGATVEDAKIEIAVNQIAQNQQYIRDNREAITLEINRLSDDISRYSYSSKSSVRYEKARTRSLLQNALANADMALDQMTELHVRGLAAARRYMETGE